MAEPGASPAGAGRMHQSNRYGPPRGKSEAAVEHWGMLMSP